MPPHGIYETHDYISWTSLNDLLCLRVSEQASEWVSERERERVGEREREREMEKWSKQHDGNIKERESVTHKEKSNI